MHFLLSQYKTDVVLNLMVCHFILILETPLMTTGTFQYLAIQDQNSSDQPHQPFLSLSITFCFCLLMVSYTLAVN